MRTFALPGAVIAMIVATGCSFSPIQYVEQGNKAFAQENYSEAEIDYQKAIQKDPNLGEAYLRLGTVQMRQAHATAAFESLLTAAQLMPASDEAQVALGDACLAAYLQNHRSAVYYDQLIKVTARLAKNNPGSYDALRLSGFTKMIDRSYPDAVEILTRAVAMKPMQEEVVHALVQCLIQNGQGAEAEKAGLGLIAAKKTFGPIYDTLYRYYLTNNRAADAEALLRTKIANNPANVQDRLQLAAHYARGQNEAAMSAVIRELKTAPGMPEALMDIGNFYVTFNRRDAALQEFRAGVNQYPKRRIDYQKRIAEVLLLQGKKEEAQALIEEILKQKSGDFETRLMRAGLNVDSGDFGRLTSGMAELEILTREQPWDAIARFNLGKARLRNGDANGALTDFKEALRVDPQLMQARILAANTSLQTEDYKGAARYADEILEVAADNPNARLLKVQSLAGLGDFTQATAEANRLNRDFPQSVAPKMELAGMALAQKRFTEAEAIYRGVYVADPKNIRALQGVSEVFFAQGRSDAAIQFLSGEMAKGESQQVRVVLAEAALRAHRADLAIQQYTLLVNSNPKSSFGHLRLGDAYLSKGDSGEAINQFQAARALSPKDPMVNSMLALSLHNAGRAQEAQKAYRDTLALESGNPLVMNNLAYLMAETGGNLDEALRLAQDASRRQPSNFSLSDTVGWIYLKKNLPDSAIQILSNVVQKDPRQPTYRYHLGAALLQKGDKVGARRELEAALANKPAEKDHQKIVALLAQIH